MRTLLPLLLFCANACAAQTTRAGTAPQPPGPAPMQAEAEQASAAIEAAARACADGRIADVSARVEPYLKVSRPMAPDLGELELSGQFRRLCGGSGTGSVAEINTMVEDVAIQPGFALATVTLYGRLRGVPSDQHFVVRGLVYLLQGPGGWRIARAAYWPHEIPPVS